MLSLFPNTELMRSPYSILGSDTVEGFEPVDLSTMPDEEYRLLLLLATQSGRPDDPSVKYEMNGDFQSFYPDADAAISKLWARGYLRKLTTREIMKSFTIADLRHAASLIDVTLKSRAKRAELLDIMLEYADEKAIIDFAETRKWLQLSDKGLLLAKSLYAERDALERKIYPMLLDGNDKKAIETWCAYKSRQYGERVQEFSKLRVSNVTDRVQRAILGCYDLYGKKPMFYPIEEPTKEAIYQRDIGRAKDQIADYMSARISRYRLACVCDSLTCEICASKDGMIYETSKAEIGVNCPPFHYGCRCFIAPLIEGISRKGTQFAKNPLTKQDYKTSAKTYKEWELSLTEEEKAALKNERGW